MQGLNSAFCILHYRGTVSSFPDRLSSDSASRSRSCQMRLNVRRHHAFATRVARRGHRAVLEPPLRVDRHVDARHRLDAGTDNVLLQRLQTLDAARRAPARTESRPRRRSTDRTVNGENASKPSAAAGAYVRT